MRSEIDWSKSDVYPQIPRGKDVPRIKPFVQQPLGIQFPNLSSLRDKLAMLEDEREEIFESVILSSIDNSTPPNYYLKLVKKFPEEFEAQIRKFFTNLA